MGSTCRAFSLGGGTHRVFRPSKYHGVLFGLRGGRTSATTTAATSFSTTNDDSTATATATTLAESSKSYAELVEKLKTITQLERASAVLSYDQLVFMPHGADITSSERGAQMAALASVIHEKKTDPKLLELVESSLNDSIQGGTTRVGTDDEIRLLELEKKSFIQNERVPATLASKAAELSTSAYTAWVKARQASDFDAFAPVLEDCFQTAMAIAMAKSGDGIKSEVEGRDLYTQMLDEFEMGMSQQRIDDIFGEIQAALVPLIAKVLDSGSAPSTRPLKVKNENDKFPIEQQKELSRRLVTAIGFNETIGRIDVSVHPFTTSFSPNDVRITSRFRDDEWYQGLAGTIHEGGHAIYEQQLPSSALSIDTALSMGTHESQSLFWERHVGLSKSFWKWATPQLQELFDNFEYSADEVYGAVNAVSRSLIRVEADELTYPLHVILRYNIEKDVIQGNLKVTDIPSRWNQEMKELLGVDVPSDDVGCLQDVHWSGLAFGYFPTYLIGSATAAQLAHYCRVDIPDMDERMERGEFSEIRQWLSSKVHSHGRRYKSLDAMLEDQVGEKLNPKYFIEYLTDKYSDLYRL